MTAVPALATGVVLKTCKDEDLVLNDHMTEVKSLISSVRTRLKQEFFARQKIAEKNQQGYSFKFTVEYGSLDDLFARGMIAQVKLHYTNESTVTNETIFTLDDKSTAEICTGTNKKAVSRTSIYSLFPLSYNTGTGYGPCELAATNKPCSAFVNTRQHAGSQTNIDFKSALLCCDSTEIKPSFAFASTTTGQDTKFDICCGEPVTSKDSTGEHGASNVACPFNFFLPYGWGEPNRTFQENLSTVDWPLHIITLTDKNHIPAFTDELTCKNAISALLTPIGWDVTESGGRFLAGPIFQCKAYQADTTTYYVIEKNPTITADAWLKVVDQVQKTTTQSDLPQVTDSGDAKDNEPPSDPPTDETVSDKKPLLSFDLEKFLADPVGQLSEPTTFFCCACSSIIVTMCVGMLCLLIVAK
jgi:hypothetical protein